MLDMSQVTVGNTDSSGAESYSENDYYHGDDYEQDVEHDAKYKGGSYTP